MRREKRFGLLALLSVIIIFGTVQNVSALVDWVDVSIDHAYYYDLDEDGASDDVLVNLTCVIHPGIRNPQRSEYYIKLTLPSGLAYLVIIDVIGKYNTLFMSLKMYDTATEPGWYNIQVDAYSMGVNRGHSTASYDFDPPTGQGTGQPTAELLAWVS
jgi:hypothetical protein